KRERVIQPLVFLPGGDHALVRHEDEHGHDQIYEMDLISRQDVHPFYTAPEGQWVQHVILSADESTVLGVRLGGGDRAIHWLDPTLAEVQAQFDKAVGNRRAEILSLTPDRKRMLVLLDRADTPGALYFYDIDQGRLQKLAPLNQPLGTTPLAPVRHVSFHARDGLAIEAILTLPPGLPAYKLPIIMLPHGGPWAHDSLDYDYWAQFLAAQGYAVMQPNFRGSTGYGTAFERKGEGQLGLAMQDDITDGLKWAVAQGLADPARACIMGGSYGGYAAMWGAAKDPDLYRCAISIAGVASLRREVNGFGDYLMGNKYRDDWGRMSADFAAVSPANAADRIKAPLLLIHGSKDVTVNPAQSELMASRMRAAGKTF
ncbi:MAG TPA: prolyl oligopeptidase family serine peptidase, partial [Novosphingobium sp.]|nr:prolyl oligopeptidase family serine peptidase [Novosphingobium sp.]